MTNCVNSDGLFVIFESGLFESLSVPLELVYIYSDCVISSLEFFHILFRNISPNMIPLIKIIF